MASHIRRFNSVLFLLGIVLLASPALAVNFTETKLRPLDGEAEDNFAWSVDIWGDYAIVGSIWDGGGSAYLYRRTNSGWIQHQKLSGPGAHVRYGQSVAISDHFAVVSAHLGGDYPQGVAFVYKRIGGSTWVYHYTLVPPADSAAVGFGHTVAVDGGFIAVSDVLDMTHGFEGGRVYVYRAHPDGSQWILDQTLDPGGLSLGDAFGSSLSLKGYTLLVGAEVDEGRFLDAGAAYIYNYQGSPGSWTLTQKLQASDGHPGAGFGRSVALSSLNDWAIVGAWQDDEGGLAAGAAYIFSNQGGTWVESTKLIGSDSIAGDEFGKSVGIDANRAVVGAWKHGANGYKAGAAYHYEFDPGTGWVETTKILASDGDPEDWFGKNVAMHSGTIIVGAPNDDDMGFNAGAAYIYEPEADGNIFDPNIVLMPWPYLYIYTGYAQTVVNVPLDFAILTPEDVVLSIEIRRAPKNGAIALDRRSNSVRYAPYRGFAGNDTFSLVVRDARGNKNEYVQEIFVKKGH